MIEILYLIAGVLGLLLFVAFVLAIWLALVCLADHCFFYGALKRWANKRWFRD